MNTIDGQTSAKGKYKIPFERISRNKNNGCTTGLKIILLILVPNVVFWHIYKT